MGTTMRAGDLFAGRYRLTVLLDESGDGRFWRARDEVLARSVAVHLMDRHDPRSPALMDAARRSARVHDRRLLRVLDADMTAEHAYVVNEWGDGLSLDLRLADQGVLSPRRAAWVVAEFADTLAAAHDVGQAHGRVVPENVLLDRYGQVRVIGFAVDAALRGEGPADPARDLADTGALLYAALTGRWAGQSSSVVPRAPHEGGRPLRARQVQAGVPGTLDLLCEQLVVPARGHRASNAGALTARIVADSLAAYVGDPSDMASSTPERPHRDALLAPPVPSRGDAEMTQVRGLPRIPPATPAPPDTPPAPAVPPVLPDQAAPVAPPARLPGPDLYGDDTEVLAPPTRPDEGEEPDPLSDLSWLTPREDAPPAPELPQVAERPLFAPEPDGEHRIRGPLFEDGPTRERMDSVPTPEQEAALAAGAPNPAVAPELPPAATGPADLADSEPRAAAAAVGVEAPGEHPWPWDDDEPDQAPLPGRAWYRLAIAVGCASLVLLLVVGLQHLLGDSDGEPTTPESTPSATVPAPVAVTPAGAVDLDPEGDDTENPELVPLAIDGDRSTAWRTAGYNDQFGPNGLKTGVGLVVDLGSVREVRQVTVRVLGGETAAQVFVTKKSPDSVGDRKPVGKQTGMDTLKFGVPPGTSGRYVTVWLTKLPFVEGWHRGQVSEIKVLATP